MTRDAGQVTTRQAVAGGLAVVALVAGVVAGLGQLIEPSGQQPPLAAPARPGPTRECPDPGRPPEPAAVEVTAGELVECPQSYDGRAVRYEGEAVRAVLRRGEKAWLHLNDDPYALTLGPLPEHRTAVGGNSGIPVLVPARVARGLSYVGDHRARGDRLAVAGTFHRAHPQDAGGPAIDARSAHVTRPGRPVAHPVERARAVTALAVALAAGAAALLARRRRLGP